ncbi:MAG: hypoxanthine phosphoribosyltransferase, partial [Planctomycetota bacterium]
MTTIKPQSPPPAAQAAIEKARMERDVERILLSEEEIRSRIDEVANDVTAHYAGKEFTVVSVLKGSCIFASDLIRRIPIPLELAFVSASSYGDGTESGELRLNFLPADNEIAGRNLLLVDDILDTGKTMHRLKTELLSMGAAEVRTCVFLDKPSRRDVTFDADYRCFEIENLFVIGYGLDFAGRYRNLPFVYAGRNFVDLQPSVLAKARLSADLS